MPAEPEDFLTVAEVADVLKLNQQTVRNWIDAGTLPAYRVGRRVRVARADFDALVNNARTGEAPTPKTKAPSYTGQQFWEGVPHPPPLLMEQ